MTTDELRAKFELHCEKYARNLSLRRHPERDYWYEETRQAWELWQAAHASRDAEVEANERAIPDDWELFCCQCFASESSGSWDHVVVGSFCTNCCGNGTAFPLPKTAIESIRNQASWVGKRYYPHKEDADMRAEVEALRKDAERYRWLRENGDQMIGRDRGEGPEWTYWDELDQAIDAAMLEESK